MQFKRRYEVRYFQTENSYSIRVGYKARLLERPTAHAIAKRLVRAGIRAFINPIRVAL